MLRTLPSPIKLNERQVSTRTSPHIINCLWYDVEREGNWKRQLKLLRGLILAYGLNFSCGVFTSWNSADWRILQFLPVPLRLSLSGGIGVLLLAILWKLHLFPDRVRMAVHRLVACHGVITPPVNLGFGVAHVATCAHPWNSNPSIYWPTIESFFTFTLINRWIITVNAETEFKFSTVEWSAHLIWVWFCTLIWSWVQILNPWMICTFRSGSDDCPIW